MADESPPREPDLRPDGYERFRAAVHAAAKNGPMHRKAKPKEESKGGGEDKR